MSDHWVTILSECDEDPIVWVYDTEDDALKKAQELLGEGREHWQADQFGDEWYLWSCELDTLEVIRAQGEE